MHMRSKKSRFVRFAGMLTATVLGASLIACTADNSGGSGNGDGGDSGEEVEFVFMIPGDPITLNPNISNSIVDQVVGPVVYEPLVRMTNSYELVPWLAQSWDISEDGLEYTLHLQEGVKWHDGEDFDAEDVKYYFDEAMQYSSAATGVLEVLDEVVIDDPHTVTLTLQSPYGPLLEVMSGQYMLPEHLHRDGPFSPSEPNFEPIGTGLFAIEAFQSGQSIVFNKFDDYWQESGDVDKLTFPIVLDPNSRALTLQGDDIDGTYGNFVDTTAQRAARANPLLVWENDNAAFPSVLNLTFNTANEALAEAGVRQALYRAMDRESISNVALDGLTTVPVNMMPAGVEWAHDASVDYREMFAFDPEAAADELDALGYPEVNGVRFEVTLPVMNIQPRVAMAVEMIKSNLEDIGVMVNIESIESTIYHDRVMGQGEFDMTMFEAYTYQDPVFYANRLYTCNPENATLSNNSGLCDEALDAALNEAEVAVGREARAEHYAFAQERAAELLFSAPIAEATPQTFVRNDRWGNLDEFLGITSRDWTALERK